MALEDALLPKLSKRPRSGLIWVWLRRRPAGFPTSGGTHRPDPPGGWGLRATKPLEAIKAGRQPQLRKLWQVGLVMRRHLSQAGEEHGLKCRRQGRDTILLPLKLYAPSGVAYAAWRIYSRLSRRHPRELDISIPLPVQLPRTPWCPWLSSPTCCARARASPARWGFDEEKLTHGVRQYLALALDAMAGDR